MCIALVTFCSAKCTNVYFKPHESFFVHPRCKSGGFVFGTWMHYGSPIRPSEYVWCNFCIGLATVLWFLWMELFKLEVRSCPDPEFINVVPIQPAQSQSALTFSKRLPSTQNRHGVIFFAVVDFKVAFFGFTTPILLVCTHSKNLSLNWNVFSLRQKIYLISELSGSMAFPTVQMQSTKLF